MFKLENNLGVGASNVLAKELSDALGPSEASVDNFVHALVAACRNHPHLNNVLTHISVGRWDRIESALVTIFSPSTKSAALTALERNLVELLWAERGITGRIATPLFLDVCASQPHSVAGHWINLIAGHEAAMATERSVAPTPEHRNGRQPL